MFAQGNGINGVKDAICAVFGIIASAIATAFGGWNSGMTTLVIFMGIDYISGLVVAGVFHKSEKTPDGRLESRAGWKGLVRKGFTLIIVLIACRLDILIGTTFVRDACVFAFIANETISIVENAGLMGIPIPNVIKQAITVLKGKADENTFAVKEMAKEEKAKMKARREKEKAGKEAKKSGKEATKSGIEAPKTEEKQEEKTEKEDV